MNNPDVDVLIIGGGPGGLYAAERLARQGVNVLVCEEHDTIGDPVHCTGILGSESFDELDLPRASVLNDLTTARFVSPSGITVSYANLTPLASVLDRPTFDRALAARATAAGATLVSGARIGALQIDDGGVRASVGARLVRARLALLACGASYAIQRRFGLGLPPRYLHTAQAELPAATPPTDVEVYFGRQVAPDGFAWIVPVSRPAGPHVRLGVMASDDAVGRYRQMLRNVGARCGLPEDVPLPRQKILPLGPIERTYANRLLVIGDAAGIVKPTTGGGIYYSIMSAALAADVAVDALGRDRLDAASLKAYEQAWRGRLRAEFAAQSALRRVVTRLTDDEIDGFFDLARTDGIMPIVRSRAKFNQHRDLIWALFRHPPARKILFRSLVG